ncbi:DUF5366 family protein [Mangrovibacillus cuniculi]|uniref:YufK family protein n=1 Tax=Mangrovibacillus cuniculi TaxID=2593652 RepID=A0A7S8CCB2_9BACI|nr:DUF5366 family protein [Mangrovibacillus cuniculi]QPC47343.1 YufK family protein [Mangrovibacillus cuniculi]
MKNTYLAGYIPLATIMLFSLAFSVNVQSITIGVMKDIGLYAGLLEFLSEVELKFAVLSMYFVAFFMIFCAVKIVSETIHEMGLLFFSNETEGSSLLKVKGTGVVYILAGLIALFVTFSFLLVLGIFVLSTVVYFFLFIYRMSDSFSVMGTLGFIFFEVIAWACIITGIGYIVLKLYTSVVAVI